ncbi:MAG: hypothetical protein A3D65_03380 [Candidatus Lloydbacteria bacterium RIFCSPHIGHO2_02_FULL_50_13]|uniref:Uncharacterized protein n=1 Tax=Candidatus Lloydbacteria bacterium RIFCSPHIGHO2_02_FULL_50_13 TaxID=1798661 RepID=A0A1G2D980_9BACT|nr:MAG: hypothetical protein A3D65_03380 [Candidatus Lloydbacteria bacterium RIFCSPHIGHO2_02_FULL_50_13]
MVVVPLIIMVPGLFNLKSAITLGVMMQVYNTFGEVNGSVSVVMNNWTTITEVRSIWRRLREFEVKLRLCEKKLHSQITSALRG